MRLWHSPKAPVVIEGPKGKKNETKRTDPTAQSQGHSVARRIKREPSRTSGSTGPKQISPLRQLCTKDGCHAGASEVGPRRTQCSRCPTFRARRPCCTPKSSDRTSATPLCRLRQDHLSDRRHLLPDESGTRCTLAPAAPTLRGTRRDLILWTRHESERAFRFRDSCSR